MQSNPDIETDSVDPLADVIFLVINLDRSPERLRAIAERFKHAQLHFTRVPAVDGASIFETCDPATKERFLRHHGRALRPGELGCYLSHLEAIKTFLSSPYPFAVVLEDDAALPADLASLRRAFENAGEWDFLRLHSRRKYLKLDLAPLDADHVFCVNLTRSTGAGAYALNRAGAHALLNAISTISLPFDHAFDCPQDFGVKYRHVHPNLFDLVWETSSTIETRAKVRAPALAKAMTLVHRARRELGRFFWALGEWMRHGRGG